MYFQGVIKHNLQTDIFQSKIMKKLVSIFIVFFLFASICQAQSLDKFFKKYSDDERFGFVSVGTGMMKFASMFAGIPSDAQGLMSKVTGLKVLTLQSDSTTADLSKSFKSELNGIIEKGDFETTLESRTKSESINIYKRVTDKNKADVLIVSKSGKETNIVWMQGKMTKDEMDKILNEKEEGAEE